MMITEWASRYWQSMTRWRRFSGSSDIIVGFDMAARPDRSTFWYNEADAWDGANAAHDRSMTLLHEQLTPDQRTTLLSDNYFIVKGGTTGKSYKICGYTSSNVMELDDNGWPRTLYCFHPEGDLPLGDVLLAQKLALELYERDTMAVVRVVGTWFGLGSHGAGSGGAGGSGGQRPYPGGSGGGGVRSSDIV